MDIRCPCCHATFALEHLTEDEALRELMAMLADLPRDVSRPLVSYVGLFRGKTRATAYERQLRLAREALALASDTALVGAAMSETVEAIRAKRDSGQDTRPLKNHNYLKSVLESVGARAAAGQAVAVTEGEAPRKNTKGVMRLLVLRLTGAPWEDEAEFTTQTWIEVLWHAPIGWDAELDTRRLRQAFTRLAGQIDRWPAPRQLLQLLPDRPQQARLAKPPMSQAKREKNRARLKQMMAELGIESRRSES